MKNDAINPDHYKQFPKESIEMMESIWGPEAVINFCVLNAFKYRMRLGHKDAVEQDMAKERWYLNKADELRTKMNGGAVEKERFIDEAFIERHTASETSEEDTIETLDRSAKVEEKAGRPNIVLIAGPKGKQRSEELVKQAGDKFMVLPGTQVEFNDKEILLIENPMSAEQVHGIMELEGADNVIITTDSHVEKLMTTPLFSISKVIRI